jgi:hypothetical protein
MNPDFLSPDFDLRAYIEQRLTEALLSTPDPVTGRTLAQDIAREDARILYGTRAVKQFGSHHAAPRRDKRRARKRRKG